MFDEEVAPLKLSSEKVAPWKLSLGKVALWKLSDKEKVVLRKSCSLEIVWGKSCGRELLGERGCATIRRVVTISAQLANEGMIDGQRACLPHLTTLLSGRLQNYSFRQFHLDPAARDYFLGFHLSPTLSYKIFFASSTLQYVLKTVSIDSFRRVCGKSRHLSKERQPAMFWRKTPPWPGVVGWGLL